MLLHRVTEQMGIYRLHTFVLNDDLLYIIKAQQKFEELQIVQLALIFSCLKKVKFHSA